VREEIQIQVTTVHRILLRREMVREQERVRTAAERF
jgi:hypothetical protein